MRHGRKPHQPIRIQARRAIASATAVALVLAQLPVAALLARPAAAQSALMSRTEYEACQARDEQGFRKAIEALTLKGLQVGLAGVDYKSLTGDEWRRIGMDEILDKQVDVAIEEVRQESSWGRLLQSLASKEEAQKIATSVAERVFKSDTVKNALEQLAGGLGKTLGKRIELATGDTAEPAQQCMQAFLGPRYGATIARVVARDAGREYAIDPTKSSTEISTTRVLTESAGSITGAVILLVRRQMANMASRVGARVVGSVLSRLVSVVAGGVGLVLIAKDIWDFRNGILPLISSEMKSKETKEKVQIELAATIQEQIGDNLKDIAAKTADRVLEIWQEFRRAHAKVIELSETNPRFKAFVETVKPDALGRLDEIVGLILASEGVDGILKRLDDGSLDMAVNRMPAAALDIAREQRSLADALAWVAVAGGDLDKVVEFEIHRRAKPDTFTRASLTRLLSVGDKVAITRLAGLSPPTRATLFELDPKELRNLGRSINENELAGLATYLNKLDKPSSARILHAVAEVPARMQVLARTSVRDGIIASKDQAAAVGMMLSSDVVPDPWQVAAHARLVLDGKIAPRLLWERHPAFVGAAGMLALLVLLIFKRLIFPRRPQVIVQHADARARHAPPIKSAKH